MEQTTKSSKSTIIKIIFTIFYCSTILLSTVHGQCFTEHDDRPQDKRKLNAYFIQEHDLSWDMFRELNRQKSWQNVLFSPYSAYQVLTLAYMMTGAETEGQFHDALRIPDDQDKIDVLQALHLEKYARNKANRYMEFEFTTADRIFVPKSTEIKRCVRQIFGKNLGRLVFKRPHEAARKVNKWVAFKTKNRITEIITPDVIRHQQLLLLNAVYFKGTWVNLFKKANTKLMSFTTLYGDEVQQMMMSQTEEFRLGVYSDRKVQVIELPYKGNQFSMFIILPFQDANVNDVLRDLSFRDLLNMTSNLRQTFVSVKIPKFSTEAKLDLTHMLMNIGFHQVLQKPINMSLLVPHKKATIAAIIQKSVIDVDEQGTVAAAVTEALIPRMMPRSFEATRPFIYYIQDIVTKHIIFAGVFKYPEDVKN